MRQTSGCKDALDAFVHKLDYRVEKMSNEELQHFPLLLKQPAGTVRKSLLAEFAQNLNLLRGKINSHFTDIDEYLSKVSWLLDPYNSTLKDVEYLGCEDELCGIQADSVSKKYLQENGYKTFWIVKGQVVALRLAKHGVTRVILPFSAIFLSETVFSALVTIKTKARNRL